MRCEIKEVQEDLGVRVQLRSRAGTLAPPQISQDRSCKSAIELTVCEAQPASKAFRFAGFEPAFVKDLFDSGAQIRHS